MKNRSLRACGWVAMFLVCTIGVQAGEVIEEIRCKKVPEVSYMIYLPSSYIHHQDPKAPVLFVMAPDGGRREDLERFIPGAEKNGWIVALSVQSGKPSRASEYAVASMVNDVYRRFTVDDRRCYASGMGWGARLAFWLANEQKKMIIGIIPCSGGDTGYPYGNRAPAYGLCGAAAYTRWEMAETFGQRVRTRGQLRFHPGGYGWPDPERITEAITWLNIRYLSEHGVQREIDRLSAILYEEILSRYKEEPYYVYNQAKLLSSVTRAPHAEKALAVAEQMEEDPIIMAYTDGLKEMDRFVEKHFNTGGAGLPAQGITLRQKEDAELLLKRFGETPLVPVFEDFARPPQNPRTDPP